MSNVVLSMTMSLDGFVAGENRSSQNPMGDGGLRLHDWLFGGKTDADEAVLNHVTSTSGAVIVGWRTYIDAVHGAWDNTNPFTMPAFIVCQEQPKPEDVLEGFTFVTEGLEVALAQARAMAGDKNVWVMGGANLSQQYLKAGLVDELYLHIAPVIFTKGLRLFDNIGDQHIELQPLETVQTPGATHVRYQVVR